ncbi:MAG: MerR family transcriptional regulator [Chitinispirillia bacterium]|nr:MerR family transcriptional regulator [Chitinispirillia bacterium]MCL2267690.1 MerR family transcriptional regulator [Chitinispirillia bacterium]
MSYNGSETDEEAAGAPARKMYYSISEVSQMTGLKPTSLRHWEKAFPKLRPKKNSADKRAYREKDIELIFRIKQLLMDEKYTLLGAKKKLAEERRAERAGGKKIGGGIDADTYIDTDADAEVEGDINTGVDAVVDRGITRVYADKPAQASSAHLKAISEIRKGLQDVLKLLEL